MYNVDFILERYEKVIAWGAGKYFERYHELLNGKIDYIVDRNVELQGEKKEGICIKSLSDLAQEQNKRGCLVVIFNAQFASIAEEAKSVGDFDIIDIRTIELLCKINLEASQDNFSHNRKGFPVLVCGGIHALWCVNGARKFIDAQNDILHREGICTAEIAPIPNYFEKGNMRLPYMIVSFNKGGVSRCSLSEFVKEHTTVQSVIIHSLYYKHEILEILLESITIQKNILYYLHDFYCICNNRFFFYQQKFCLDKENQLRCKGCDNEEYHMGLYRFHQKLFDKYNIKLVAPSRDTALRVGEVYKKNDIITIPHLSYQWSVYPKERKKAIKIAYLGGMAWNKGWNDYQHIFAMHKDNYQFYCLGRYEKQDCVEGITNIDVTFEEEPGSISMVEALKKYKIDIAYLGAIWPETFSYTYYEASEAGCFVITNELSGNICDQVRRNGNGIVLRSVDDVIKWLGNIENVSKAVCGMNKRLIDVKPDETFLKYCL